jgi:hypothetical protein
MHFLIGDLSSKYSDSSLSSREAITRMCKTYTPNTLLMHARQGVLLHTNRTMIALPDALGSPTIHPPFLTQDENV